MAKDSRTSSTKTRQAGKSSEPLAEHAPMVKLIAVKPESAEKWKDHRLEKMQRTKAAEMWKAHRLEKIRQSKAADPAAGKPEPRKQKHGWQLDRINEMLPRLFPPHGRVPADLTIKAVQRLIEPMFEKNGWKPPGPDSVARALGRRNRRG